MRDPRRFLLLLIIGVLAGYAWWRYDHRSRISDKFPPAAAPKLSLDDVKVLAEAVLAHRLVTRSWAAGGHPDAGPIVRDVLSKLKVPT